LNEPPNWPLFDKRARIVILERWRNDDDDDDDDDDARVRIISVELIAT
jgi:hypothetical protein